MYHSTRWSSPSPPCARATSLRWAWPHRGAAHPGHTPDSLSLLVADTARSDEAWLLLSGDLLSWATWAGPTWRQRIPGGAGAKPPHQPLRHPGGPARPPGGVPAHGAGSLCGRGMSALRSSTLGFERLANPMLQLPEFAAFRKAVTTALPARPKSFSGSSPSTAGSAPARPLPPGQGPEPGPLRRPARDRGLGHRHPRPRAFGGAHIPDSLNIGFEPASPTGPAWWWTRTRSSSWWWTTASAMRPCAPNCTASATTTSWAGSPADCPPGSPAAVPWTGSPRPPPRRSGSCWTAARAPPGGRAHRQEWETGHIPEPCTGPWRTS
jgi:hypothetical protein